MSIATVNGLELWYETIGNNNNPAILLIMGGCSQGILWPTEFCNLLADSGFYVIRYDHRDTGQSSFFDYQTNPYTIEDMMIDAIGLLDYLQIEQFQLMALSMGVPIAELMAVNYPKRTKSLVLISSSCDFRPMNRAYAGLPQEEGMLPPPKEVYLQWMNKFVSTPPKNDEELIQFRVEGWQILNGNKIPFEKDLYYQLQQEYIQRARDPNSHLNHVNACYASEELVKAIPSKITVPTVVIHGTEDPILPPEHGQALASKIKNARYVLLDGYGHVPNSYFYEQLIHQAKIEQKNSLIE